MRALGAHRRGIAEAECQLRDGLVVAIPTETVYGLAADASNEDAVAMVFSVKSRPAFDPLIVHVAEAPAREAVQGVVDLTEFEDLALRKFRDLTSAFWPGPLTLVLPRDSSISDLITAGLPTVAVRMPDHPVAQALLQAFGGPLVAPSANRFGRISPTRAEHVMAELEGRVPSVLDGGPCRVGVESTIVALAPDGRARLLRPGGIPRAAIEACIGPLVDEARHAVEAPGQLTQHYAPQTRCRLLPSPIPEVDAGALRAAVQDAERIGVLRVLGPIEEAERALRALGLAPTLARTLSASGSLTQAARNLFATLRAMDEAEVDVLLLEPCGTREGLGHAIDDRLQRAAAEAADPIPG